jgi:2,3-bisphosphoglycerate-independent phosphoglycerate mutase
MILDGWGKSPDPKVSAIDNANIPFINALYQKYPSAQLRTDGLNVGLPEGQMGNSEVGHMNLGAGRIIYQDLAKINLAVQNKTFNKEKAIADAFQYAKEYDKDVHFLGLVSDGGVHSHINHLKGLIDAAHDEGLEKVYIHAFTEEIGKRFYFRDCRSRQRNFGKISFCNRTLLRHGSRQTLGTCETIL